MVGNFKKFQCIVNYNNLNTILIIAQLPLLCNKSMIAKIYNIKIFLNLFYRTECTNSKVILFPETGSDVEFPLDF